MKSETAKAGIGYTVANILIKGINFLTLPIFSRILGPEDFGIYNLFIAYDAVLFCVIGFALHSCVRSTNWTFPGKIDEYVSSLCLIYIINMLLLLVVVGFGGQFIGDVLGVEIAVLVCLVLHSFGTALVTLYNNRISLQYSYTKYMVVAGFNSIGNVTLSLFLILTILNGQRYLGRIAGASIALFLLGIVLVFLFWKRARPRIDLAYWRFGLRYSLPIVPHGISQVILAQFGRLMVYYMVSSAAAGIFGLAANLMLVMTVLTDSIATVWSTWFFETMEGEKADEATKEKKLSDRDLFDRMTIIQRRSGLLLFAFSLLSMGMMAFAPELMWILGGDEYMTGSYCVFGLVLSGFCVFAYNLIVVGEYYCQKTVYVMAGTVVAALINIVLNVWAIPAFGFVAAAYTTLVSYTAYVLFHWLICRRVLGFDVLNPRAALASCIMLGACVAFDIVFIWEPLVRLFANAIVLISLCVIGVNRYGGVRRLFGKIRG